MCALPHHARDIKPGYQGSDRWHPLYFCEWGHVVGDRIRRIRRERGITLKQLAQEIPKPDGGHYHPTYLSRLERGWAKGSLYLYLAIAATLEIEPGHLLGPDSAQQQITEGELTLVRAIREARIEPHEALVRLLTPAATVIEPPGSDHPTCSVA